MRLAKIILLISTFISISACSSTKDTSSNPEIDNNIKVAKINAQLGIAYLEQKNYQRSKIKLLLAIKQAPNIPEPWYSMAYFLEATGETQSANEYYLKAIKVAPNRGDAHNNYGTYLCRHAQYRESVREFLLATKDPDYLNTADAYENAGNCSMKAKDIKAAAQYYSLALIQDPELPNALINMAEIDLNAGKIQAARIKLEKFNAVSKPTAQSIRIRERLNEKLAAADKTVTVTDSPYSEEAAS